MEGSIVVGKTASDNSNKETVINLDAVQCNVERTRGRDSLSVKQVRKIKIKENGKTPVIDGIETNKLGKKANSKSWERFIVEVDKSGNKVKKSLGKVESEHSNKSLDKKLEKAREKAASKGGKSISKKDNSEKAK